MGVTKLNIQNEFQAVLKIKKVYHFAYCNG
jgi:hypothetical protein